MYVMNAIEKSDRLYPNEYTDEEKIDWINELNRKIALEYKKIYNFAVLIPAIDGGYLLPEDVTWERVYSIRTRRREIKKEDFRTHGISFLMPRRVYIPDVGNEDIFVVYLETAEDIRIINLDNAKVTLASNGFYLDKGLFQAGDVINIKGTINDDETDKNYNVFSCYLPEDGTGTEFFTDLGDNAFESEGAATVSIHRLITDRTLCEAPYDDMYVQWVCAKICFWQKAFEGYNQHMTMFNQILSDYSHMIVENTPSSSRVSWQKWI